MSVTSTAYATFLNSLNAAATGTAVDTAFATFMAAVPAESSTYSSKDDPNVGSAVRDVQVKKNILMIKAERAADALLTPDALKLKMLGFR